MSVSYRATLSLSLSIVVEPFSRVNPPPKLRWGSGSVSADRTRPHLRLLAVSQGNRAEHPRGVGECDREGHGPPGDPAGEHGRMSDSPIYRIRVDVAAEHARSARIDGSAEIRVMPNAKGSVPRRSRLISRSGLCARRFRDESQGRD